MRCVVAGGGTGGHLFPGIAIAEAFTERETGNEVLFIGTERGIEVRVLAGGKFPLKTIRAMPLKGRSFLQKIKALGTLPLALSEALSVLKEFRPQLVLGVGGYASGPALLAASLLGIKRAIHEQNMVPGMTNRILRGFSQRVFVSFEETKKYFSGKKTIVTGNPIRKEFLFCSPHRQKTEKFTVLIFGGSAGAHRINEAMMNALPSLQGIKSALRFIHQTGRDDLEFVSNGYAQEGFDALVKSFFEDMVTQYQGSDLVICRAGASTLSELAVCGKGAILIPYPYAAHQHQLINARRLVNLGAARMVEDKELAGQSLAQAILHIYSHPEELRRMEEAIRRVARPKAAQEIVDQCYALVHS
ncbi:MAG TPA: undecaprenyldiphospho-muramoylpentapeptide beta-N-acetylglucosaminyltransferase [Thermodesulfobacteriota bacterium]|nr:undecaprenyldiphospho-muramoylpentapeptide beta-N-acetylglucosaminyltransferase [Thermodesulfobacteriota bacterium]